MQARVPVGSELRFAHREVGDRESGEIENGRTWTDDEPEDEHDGTDDNSDDGQCDEKGAEKGGAAVKRSFVLVIRIVGVGLGGRRCGSVRAGGLRRRIRVASLVGRRVAGGHFAEGQFGEELRENVIGEVST